MNLYLTGECSNPIEVTKALAVGYVDPVLEGQISPVHLGRYSMDLTHLHVWGMENGSQILKKFNALVYSSSQHQLLVLLLH